MRTGKGKQSVMAAKKAATKRPPKPKSGSAKINKGPKMKKGRYTKGM